MNALCYKAVGVYTVNAEIAVCCKRSCIRNQLYLTGCLHLATAAAALTPHKREALHSLYDQPSQYKLLSGEGNMHGESLADFQCKSQLTRFLSSLKSPSISTHTRTVLSREAVAIPIGLVITPLTCSTQVVTS